MFFLSKEVVVGEFFLNFIYDRPFCFDIGFGDDALKFFVRIFSTNFCRGKVGEIGRENLFGFSGGFNCYR